MQSQKRSSINTEILSKVFIRHLLGHIYLVANAGIILLLVSYFAKSFQVL